MNFNLEQGSAITLAGLWVLLCVKLTCQVHDLCEPDDSEERESAAAEPLERAPSPGPVRRLHPDAVLQLLQSEHSLSVTHNKGQFRSHFWRLFRGSLFLETSLLTNLLLSCVVLSYGHTSLSLCLHPSHRVIIIYYIALIRVINSNNNTKYPSRL